MASRTPPPLQIIIRLMLMSHRNNLEKDAIKAICKSTDARGAPMARERYLFCADYVPGLFCHVFSHGILQATHDFTVNSIFAAESAGGHRVCHLSTSMQLARSKCGSFFIQKVNGSRKHVPSPLILVIIIN